ncbi:GGDEF domain-containing protein [Paenibacillus lignilyticus]|uniref:GGDEF domain-containing protein n=1 Tax=Paenibacillus lignilyticus TaxID=1172615 RepID=A0ABS5CHI8_9BACL|nr:GGDEF domain-containing protein [Paenibacillus lignilyticus]MBP3965288.1 GGDEF domain-containing protein [Paenibacillus lignilyticus]
MKYAGRIAITTVVVAMVVMARIYGSVYYNYPLFQLPYLGLPAVVICWWLGSQYDKVRFYAEKDVLTELYNRRFVLQQFPRLLARMDKRNESLRVYLIDVDNFKRINDTYGHDMGDQVLQAIATILSSHTTNKEIIARWAGDEFLIISPSSDEDTRGGEALMVQITDTLKILSKAYHMDVSVSIGTSVYPNDAQDLDDLLNAADRQMYDMKSRQRNATFA